MKKILLFILILSVLSVLCACGQYSGGNSGQAQYQFYLTLSYSEINMEKGDDFNLKASYSDNKSVISYSSDDENIATVTNDGKIHAVNVGECYITACVGEIKKSCKVTVVSPNYSIELLYSDVDYIVVGTKINITALLYKDGVRIDGELKWSVSPLTNCSLKTYENSAVFEATQEGVYTIVVSNEKCETMCRLNVVNVA